MARRFQGVPRTVGEARRRGHRKVANMSLSTLSTAEKREGTHFSKSDAKPGDIAWMGPCMNGTRIVCYYDANMDPSDCRNLGC